MNQIPKLVHLYWGGEDLSYLHFLTVVSLHKTNPDYQIIIHTSKIPSAFKVTWPTHEQQIKYTGINYWFELKQLPYVTINEIDFKKLLNIPNEISDVHKSDFIRLYYLATEGGIWSDFDIIYLKQFNNIELSWTNGFDKNDLNTIICFDGMHYPIGILMSTKGNEYFIKAFETSKQKFNPQGYQSIGCSMFMGLYKHISDIPKHYPKIKLGNLSMTTFYPINFEVNELLFHEAFKFKGKELIKNNTVGIHWYNGHPSSREFCNKFDRSNLINCLATDLLKDIL